MVPLKDSCDVFSCFVLLSYCSCCFVSDYFESLVVGFSSRFSLMFVWPCFGFLGGLGLNSCMDLTSFLLSDTPEAVWIFPTFQRAFWGNLIHRPNDTGT